MDVFIIFCNKENYSYIDRRYSKLVGYKAIVI
jgi:hypothetical protein